MHSAVVFIWIFAAVQAAGLIYAPAALFSFRRGVSQLTGIRPESEMFGVFGWLAGAAERGLFMALAAFGIGNAGLAAAGWLVLKAAPKMKLVTLDGDGRLTAARCGYVLCSAAGGALSVALALAGGWHYRRLIGVP